MDELCHQTEFGDKRHAGFNGVPGGEKEVKSASCKKELGAIGKVSKKNNAETSLTSEPA